MKEFWLIVHLTSLAVGFGGGLALLVLMLKANKLSPEKRGEFMQTAGVLGRITPYGLIGLIVSGIAMTMPLWDGLKTEGLFHMKLTLVVIVSGLIGFAQVLMKKARTQGMATVAGKMKIVSPLISALNFIIVILAVVIFK